uniref:Uncharacterized protein n=1 Tax=Ignisphaera aggregans TaxID=334771 RepID=A0A7J2U4J6_9CREN
MKPETQIPNQSQVQQLHQPLEFEAPCCESIRECNIRKIYIIGFRNGKPKVLRAIDAVRCYRGITKKFKFYPSLDVILVKYYRSNRGVHYITVLWKPESLTEEQARLVAAAALGIYEEEVIA